jgi:hypothetical protein
VQRPDLRARPCAASSGRSPPARRHSSSASGASGGAFGGRCPARPARLGRMELWADGWFARVSLIVYRVADTVGADGQCLCPYLRGSTDE